MSFVKAVVTGRIADCTNLCGRTAAGIRNLADHCVLGQKFALYQAIRFRKSDIKKRDKANPEDERDGDQNQSLVNDLYSQFCQ